MENTCNYPDCGFAKFHKFKKPDQCPNYLENWFRTNAPGADQTPKLVRDCAPRRTLIMIQELYNRDIGVQQALEQQRNVTFKVVSKFNQILDLTARKLSERGEFLPIEQIEIPEGADGRVQTLPDK